MRTFHTEKQRQQYAVRNNAHKFLKRFKARLCDIYNAHPHMKNQCAVNIMEAIQSLYDAIVTDRMTTFEIDPILVLADKMDELQFAEAFYNYLTSGAIDGFTRTYDGNSLELGLYLAYYNGKNPLIKREENFDNEIMEA